MITPYFDPLACKLIVTGKDRTEAVERILEVLTKSKIYGPPNNVAYLRAICDSPTFRAGNAMTVFLDSFPYTPRYVPSPLRACRARTFKGAPFSVIDVLSGGIDTTIQDYPGRLTGFGMPRSGPMDSLAPRIANLLVGNAPTTEVLEITLLGPSLRFRIPTVVSLAGPYTKATMRVDGKSVEVPMWTRVAVPAGATMRIAAVDGKGCRAYLAVRGGFPEVPPYLGSKSTSMGLGGYQVCFPLYKLLRSC